MKYIFVAVFGILFIGLASCGGGGGTGDLGATDGNAANKDIYAIYPGAASNYLRVYDTTGTQVQAYSIGSATEFELGSDGLVYAMDSNYLRSYDATGAQVQAYSIGGAHDFELGSAY